MPVFFYQTPPALHPMAVHMKNSNTLDDFKDGWQDEWTNDINNQMVIYKSNFRLAYANYCVQTDYPARIAIALNKTHFLPFLYQKGARDENNGNPFSYAIQCHINRLINLQALKNVYSTNFHDFYANDLCDLSKNVPAFDFVFQKLSLNTTQKTLKEMVVDDGLLEQSQFVEFFTKLKQHDYFRQHLKPTLLEIIKQDNTLKTLLKIRELLGLRTSLIDFLRTSKERKLNTDTSHYKKLMDVLSSHSLFTNEAQMLLKACLAVPENEGAPFTPNPAMAALYFATTEVIDQNDMNILQRHLMITTPAFTDKDRECLLTLLTNKLTKDDLRRLKQNLQGSFNANPQLRVAGECLDAESSPLSLIVRTQVRRRKTYNECKTYLELKKLGVFKASTPVKIGEAAYQQVTYMPGK